MELFVTRPQHDDTTFYLSKWIELVFELCKQKGVKIYDFAKERATALQVVSFLEKKSPILLYSTGMETLKQLQGTTTRFWLKAEKTRKF